MGVRCPRNILSTCAVLDSQDALRDHLAGIGADDVHAEDAVRLRLGDELDRALRVEVRLGARVGEEGEAFDLVLRARGGEGGLGRADPGDLWVRVHN